jgi:sulfur carrier protein ThiS
MQITIKLYAMLSEYLPPDAVHHVSHLDMPDTTSISNVIEHLHLPEELVHLVLVNGVYVPPSQHPTTALKDTDTVAIWPPVAGG